MITLKKFLTAVIILFMFRTFAQDGSDILYIKVSELDSSYVGKMAHLDFYNRSFGFIKQNSLDTIEIELNKRTIKFKEHRGDDGLNNWFSEQYLESIEYIDGYKIRISKCMIEKISANHISVILYLEFTNKNGKIYSEKSENIEYTFPKNIIAEILVQS